MSYPWSSFGGYLAAAAHRPAWLRVDRVLGEHGIAEDTPEGRVEFERRMEARRREKADGREWAAVRRGWCLGSEEFRRQMLDRIAGRLGDSHGGELRQESAENKAERIIAEELRPLGWTPEELGRRPKSDPEKLALAARLRSETTLTMKWMAARLKLGTWKSARAALHKLKKTSKEAGPRALQAHPFHHDPFHLPSLHLPRGWQRRPPAASPIRLLASPPSNPQSFPLSA